MILATAVAGQQDLGETYASILILVGAAVFGLSSNLILLEVKVLLPPKPGTTGTPNNKSQSP
jgi:hypothetical protein